MWFRYRTHLVEQVRESLESADSPRVGIDRIVRFMMTSRYRKELQDGCLVSNAALELADQDAEVAEHVSTMLTELGVLFERALSAAQAKGEVTERVSARLLAAFLINSIEGMRIVEKTDPGEKAAQALADFVLGQLDP